MKIAYVLNTYPQPSHSFIRRELGALERLGFTVSRLAMRRSEADLVDAGDVREAEQTEYVLDRGAARLLVGVIAAGLRAPRRLASALWLAVQCGRVAEAGVIRHLIYLAEAVDVRARCAQAGVDHIHAHFGTNAATVAMLVHALGGPRFSFTVHGPEEFDAVRALALRQKLARAAFVVGVSQYGRSQLCRWTAFARWNRLHVVHCGIDPDQFSDPAPLPDGPVRLVAIGRFVEQKGQMVLIRAMATLRDSHSDVHLTLVGDGEMRPDLERAIAEHGLQDHVTLTGWLSEQGVQDQLDAAHALVMPSFAEGLPMVVMEAMANARPVVATYIAGTPELVVPGETGWLVPAGDEHALAQAIAGLAATPLARLDQMGKAGRTRALARHDVNQSAAQIAALIRGKA